MALLVQRARQAQLGRRAAWECRGLLGLPDHRGLLELKELMETPGRLARLALRAQLEPSVQEESLEGPERLGLQEDLDRPERQDHRVLLVLQDLQVVLE